MATTGLYQLVTDIGEVIELGMIVPQVSRPTGNVPTQFYRRRGSRFVTSLTDGIEEASAANWAWHGAVQGVSSADASTAFAGVEGYLENLRRALPNAVRVVRKRDNAWVTLNGGGGLIPTMLSPWRYDVVFSLRATYLGWFRDNVYPLGSGRVGTGSLPVAGQPTEVF